MIQPPNHGIVDCGSIVSHSVVWPSPGLAPNTGNFMMDHTQSRRNQLTLVSLVAVIALMIAFYTGALYDYPAYVQQWGKLLDRGTPSYAYGPAFNLLAGVSMLHPLLPKLTFVFVWIISCWYLLNRLAVSGTRRSWMMFWYLALLFNPHCWIFVVLYGSVDALVAGLCLLALALHQARQYGTAGLVLVFAVLLKIYPLVLLPFLVFDDRRINWKLLITALLAITVGIGLSVALWGEAAGEPLRHVLNRSPAVLSIFRYLQGSASPLYGWPIHLADLSLPAMAVAGGMVFVLAQKWRVPAVSGAFAGLMVTLALYKLGNIQFFLVIPFVAGYWFTLRFPQQDWRLSSSLIAIVGLLAGMAVLYEVARLLVPGGWGMGDWSLLHDWVGLPTFGVFAACLVALLRYERRQRRHLSTSGDGLGPELGELAGMSQHQGQRSGGREAP